MSASGAFTPTPRTSPVEMQGGPGSAVQTISNYHKKKSAHCRRHLNFRRASLLCLSFPVLVVVWWCFCHWRESGTTVVWNWTQMSELRKVDCLVEDCGSSKCLNCLTVFGSWAFDRHRSFKGSWSEVPLSLGWYLSRTNIPWFHWTIYRINVSPWFAAGFASVARNLKNI